MLQQTRVAAVIPYYERFLERFPDVRALAEASEQELLAVWSGLGYYSRARNMQRAARRIVEWGGFPETCAEIRALPGVGEYTAAAVASIAFGERRAAVDGNVLRVMSRLSNDAGEIRATATRRRLGALAGELLDPRQPGEFNQALMELGATVCTPRQPRCEQCPVAKLCEARRAGTERELPVRLVTESIRRIRKTVVVLHKEGRVLLRQRPADAAKLPGFWELPEPGEVPEAELGEQVGQFRHAITNHRYTFRVVLGRLRRTPQGFQWKDATQLDEIALSTIARKALKKL